MTKKMRRDECYRRELIVAEDNSDAAAAAAAADVAWQRRSGSSLKRRPFDVELKHHFSLHRGRQLHDLSVSDVFREITKKNRKRRWRLGCSAATRSAVSIALLGGERHNRVVAAVVVVCRWSLRVRTANVTAVLRRNDGKCEIDARSTHAARSAADHKLAVEPSCPQHYGSVVEKWWHSVAPSIFNKNADGRDGSFAGYDEHFSLQYV